MKKELMYLSFTGFPHNKSLLGAGDWRKIGAELRNRGYRTFKGRVEYEYDFYNEHYIVCCHITTHDLLFKQFDWPWVAPYKKLRRIKRRVYGLISCETVR
jgi:hypothetical protein